MKVKIRTGDINIVVDREKFPDNNEIVAILKDYLDKNDDDKIGVGILTTITAGRGRNAHTIWIATKSLLQQMGIKVEA